MDIHSLLLTPQDDEIAAFGSNWLGVHQYPFQQNVLIASYPAGEGSDGQSTEVYCYAAPARFYEIKVLAETNSVGEMKPAYSVGTGSGEAAMAATVAKAISEGMLAFTPGDDK